ncbi:MAG: hypothetical protein K0R15_793 [Clostridiales bacterium]|jgi:AcrR family transcriptional regulator|nr:hypothetical protein [Clostridiales bacterium]
MARGFNDKDLTLIKKGLLTEGKERLKITGLKKTTVDDLVRAVCISKGAFYKFYPSKEALFFHVLELAQEKPKQKFLDLCDDLDYNSVDSLKDAISQAVFSEEMDAYLRLFNKEEYDYIFRVIEPHILSKHLHKDYEFIKKAFRKLEMAGLDVIIEPEQVQAYLVGFTCIFFEREKIGDKFFAAIVNSYIDSFVDRLLF